ncbi:hypothetical protein ABT187_37285 [Streptomyces sp. NPDC001817]|uniref:hypothetical protein n=1 Tax=Streptomyces sp. NPDC001817 TaxID=3154398 RepID=UPI00332FFAA5
MTDAQEIVERQLAAYNDHDMDAFVATYADDVRVRLRDGTWLRGATLCGNGMQPSSPKAGAGRRSSAGSPRASGWWTTRSPTGWATFPFVSWSPIVCAGLIDRVNFLG